MAKRIIGVVGKIGSGKDEVLKYINARYGVPYISTGDLVRDLAKKKASRPHGKTWKPSPSNVLYRWARDALSKW